MSGVHRKMMVKIVRKIPWLELSAEVLGNSGEWLMQLSPADSCRWLLGKQTLSVLEEMLGGKRFCPASCRR